MLKIILAVLLLPLAGAASAATTLASQLPAGEMAPAAEASPLLVAVFCAVILLPFGLFLLHCEMADRAERRRAASQDTP